MELGEKLRQSRQEAGLSQRQLCGEIITRNMLSQIEHGTARPSMDTLRQLASRLGKPVSYFLDEDAAVSPNQGLMEQARRAEPAEARLLLQAFQMPDPVLEWEWRYRSFAAALTAAEQALAQGKTLYARQLLEEAAEFDAGIPELKRQRLLTLAKVPGENLTEIAEKLPSLDEELLLRAQAALARKNPDRAAGLLGAVENQNDPQWHLLRGRAYFAEKQYSSAAEHLELAADAHPEICLPLLEECFRELGDFRRAYEYACRQR